MAKEDKAEPTIRVDRIDIGNLEVRIVGSSALIVHNWSEKAVNMMLDKHMKKAVKGRDAKDPQEDYEATLYRMPDGTCGFPAVGFKASMVAACRQVDGLPMTEAKGSLFVKDNDSSGLVRIHGVHQCRRDMVRNATGVSDIRFRAEFPYWFCDLSIEFNKGKLSAEMVANLLETAGFCSGIGEWRPSAPRSATGAYGRFHIARAADNELITRVLAAEDLFYSRSAA